MGEAETLPLPAHKTNKKPAKTALRIVLPFANLIGNRRPEYTKICEAIIARRCFVSIILH
jgi:hypothetical protein